MSSSTAPARTVSHALYLGRRLLSRTTPTCSSHTSHGAGISSPLLVVNNASILSSRQQTRTNSSIRSSTNASKFSSKSTFDPLTYSALRNSVPIISSEKGPEGRSYVSPYSKFFNNIEAGRTSLGTTKAMEQRVFEIQEQRLECGIPESELRFRTMSYGRFALPPYVSPGEHRVTVKVALSAIPFENDQEKEIFLEIVGSRFNPKKGDLQLSSEKFASRIENKRYLVDMIEKIVSNARKLAKEFDGAGEDGKANATAN